MKPELRTLPVIGTHYVEHSIWVDGVCAHRQLSPYSDSEVKERVARFRSPSAPIQYKPGANYRSTNQPKPKGYVWRTGVDEQ